MTAQYSSLFGTVRQTENRFGRGNIFRDAKPVQNTLYEKEKSMKGVCMQWFGTIFSVTNPRQIFKILFHVIERLIYRELNF